VIAYFDTSAVVPLLVDEPGSSTAATLWDRADRVVSVRLVYAEARAALAQAARMGRLPARQLRTAVRAMETLYDELDLVEVDDELVRRAGELAEGRALRGYDAVHLAAAALIDDDDLVVVAGDRALLGAASHQGMATVDVRSNV
jgi:uncharacterized protein